MPPRMHNDALTAKNVLRLRKVPVCRPRAELFPFSPAFIAQSMGYRLHLVAQFVGDYVITVITVRYDGCSL